MQSRILRRLGGAFAPLCLCALLVSCSHHKPFDRENEPAASHTIQYGITFQDKHIISYSYLNGDTPARPKDFEIVDSDEGITFLNHKATIPPCEAAEDRPRCADYATLRSRLLEMMDEVPKFLVLGGYTEAPLFIEILLLPPSKSYKYGSRYKRADNGDTVRFAFHHNTRDISTSANEILKTLGHEYVHYLYGRGDSRPANRVSEEVIARVTEQCLGWALLGAPLETSRMVSKDDLERFLAKPYASAVAKLQNNPSAVQSLVISDAAILTLQKSNLTTLERFCSAGIRSDLDVLDPSNPISFLIDGKTGFH